MSPKATLHMAISQGINDYYGPTVPYAISRHDTTQSAQMGVDWIPQRALTITYFGATQPTYVNARILFRVWLC